MLAFKDYIKEMSESERHALRSNLILLLQHLLSVNYTKGTVLQYNLNGWTKEIAAYRLRLLRLITKGPFLKPELKRVDLASAYASALKNVTLKFRGQGFCFPDSCPYSLEEVIGQNVWGRLQQ